jgi:phospholipid/cholesterol/gamma-HCH transport system substrate-binding protein
VVFLVVLALLVALTVALYNKDFTRVVHVTLKTDRIGNQLTKGADVKVRGVLVGEVRGISSKGNGAELDLALKPDAVKQIPADATAQLLPKTLFGEKYVELGIPASADTATLHSGSVIEQDRSTTALETETAINNLLPLLRSLQPQQLSVTLNALSTALRGRGNMLGQNLVRTAAYLKQIDPSLPTLAQDMQGLADLANSTADTTPHLLAVLDNLSASSRNLVQEKPSLDTFLRTSTTFAASAQSIVAQNQTRLVALARDSVPVLQLYATYAAGYPCLAASLSALESPLENAFGGLQKGLHINVELPKDNGGYDASMTPRYGDTGGITCKGLDPKHPEVPMTLYYNPTDGYYDGQVVDPYTGKPPCTHTPCAYPPSRKSAAVTAVAAAKLGVGPDAVPDVAVLLLDPLASGTTIGLSS